jgi:hypothetical protein
MRPSHLFFLELTLVYFIRFSNDGTPLFTSVGERDKYIPPPSMLARLDKDFYFVSKKGRCLELPKRYKLPSLFCLKPD